MVHSVVTSLPTAAPSNEPKAVLVIANLWSLSMPLKEHNLLWVFIPLCDLLFRCYVSAQLKNEKKKLNAVYGSLQKRIFRYDFSKNKLKRSQLFACYFRTTFR